MSLNENILDKVDLYLTGKLSPIEKTQFESEIASNIDLKNEVNFQKDIIDSIKESRRQEIKSKLQSVEVSSKPKWMSKTFLGGAAAATVIGVITLGYYEYNKNNNNPNIEAITHNIITDYTPVSESENAKNNINIVSTTATDETVIKENISVSEENSTTTEALNTEHINAPNLDINTEEDNAVTSNTLATMDDFESTEIMKGGAVDIEVEFKNPNSSKLAYKFYDQKLYLFGKFNKKNPYEVIEINTKFGKEFYLKFDKSYYTIKNGMVEKTPLFRVENSKLIEKLESLN